MKVIKNIKHTIRDIYFAYLGKYNPKKLADVRFRRAFKRPLNWDNPQDINEKINWLKFNSDTTKWSELADKYKVRQYVKDCGLEDMLVKLYGKWDKAEDIEWDKLPNSFVMKTNNGSGDVLICLDKSKLDTKTEEAKFAKLLKVKFGQSMGEPHYDKIKPCIIAEELLDNEKQAFKSTSLIDYKIWCFDGKPAYVWVCYNRAHHKTDVAVYDLDWNFHPEYSNSIPHYVLSSEILPRPQSLDKMLEAAGRLSKGFPELRVDLYEVDGKPYFGEMTFTSSAGLNDFYSQEFLNILGDLVNLDKVKRNN